MLFFKKNNKVYKLLTENKQFSLSKISHLRTFTLQKQYYELQN
jgi:hypothetical protein